MTRVLLAFLVVFGLLPAVAKAADVVADSKIQAVTVYTNRATVTRWAVVDIPAGAHSVVFQDLPAILLPDSLRAEGKAAATVKFGAVTHKRVTSSELASAKERELNDQLEGLQDQVYLMDAERQALQVRKTFLENIGKQATLRTNEDIAELDLKPDQWAGAAATIHQGMSEILKAEVELGIKKRDLDRKIQKVREELNQLRTGQRSSYEVSVPLESAAATQLMISLSYQVPNARWKPVYDARLDTGASKLDLIQYGAVSQRTGEDWSGVVLTLSTAQPQRGASLPDLNPWWVDLWSPENRGRLMKSMSMGGTAMAVMSDSMDGVAMEENMAMSSAAPVPMREAEFAVAEIETGGFVSEYKIPGPAVVLADGSETKLMVGAFDTESAIMIHVKPQMSTDAFLVAQTKLKGESPLLPGPVSLFRDGAFVGQSALPLLRPAEEYALYFGVDDQVSVTRKVMLDERKDAGVISRDNTLERHYVTAIQNLHNQPVTVVVAETVPTPRNEKIDVKLVKDNTTAGYEEDADDVKGLLRWEMKLAPKAEKKVVLGWKVTWPKDQNLSGL
ncbi:MAG: mucoidy inhibitor MuiA family protein [Rhodospirillales bacterium]|nr:mucoidy inhibitor MuiA family protein [Rhodospirillales bacterium]